MSEFQMDVRNRYDAQQRLLDLIAASCNGAAMDKAGLAEKYETSVRTVERDLEKLSDFGFRIEKLEDQKFKLVSGPDNPLISAAVRQFAEKSDVSNLYPGLETRFLRELLEGRYDEVLNVNTGRFKQSPYEIQLFPKLIRAVTAKNLISFNYKGKKRESVEPYRLLNRGGVWYLLAHEEKLKTFAVSEISFLSLHEDELFSPSAARLEEVQRISEDDASPWMGDKEILFRLKVDASVASYFKKRKFFPAQRLSGADSDGSIYLESKAHHENAVLPIVFSWLPYIRVVEPEGFQQKIHDMMDDYIAGSKA